MKASLWRAALPALFLFVAAAGAAGAAEPDPVPLGPLPAGVAPAAYRLNLTIDPAEARFRGHTEIDTTFAAPARSLFLHGNGLRVAQVRARVGGKVFAGSYRQVDPSGVARVDFPSALPAGPVTLVFEYSAPLGDSPEGLFRARVGKDWYAWTQFEPIDARRMFPGFDQPGFKTPFTLTVTVPKGQKVFANAPETAAVAQGKLVSHHFAPTRPLPTYLVAIGVGPFDVRETSVPPNAVRTQPLPFRVIATRGQAARMELALAQAPRLLGLLETTFGSAYPYEKLDFIASPNQLGAMENAGLILFADSLILLDAGATDEQLRGFGEVSAHEMAHQWVGDLVTPAWWTDLWLNESFAEWMGKKVADQWRPDLGIAATELGDAFEAMDVDALGQGRPIHQAIERNAQIASAFDSITYQKGAQVLSMFESYLGSDAFAAGVRLHLGRHRYGNATADDFFGALAEAAGNEHVVPAMRSFTDQTGVPVVKVTAAADGLHLAQARYRPLGGGATPSPAQTWIIPICLSRAAQRSCTLLADPAATLAVPGPDSSAVMPNAGGAGYYRFALDGPGWDRLVAAAPGMPGRDAMTLADSLWADFSAGGADMGRVIAGARALASNPERLAAIALGQRLHHLAETLLEPGQLPAYHALVRSIYGAALQALGSRLGAGIYASEPSERRALRESLIGLMAFDGADPELRTRLAAAARADLDGVAGALDPSLRGVAYGVAAQEGGLPLIERLRAALSQSADAHVRGDASLALGLVDSAALAPESIRIALAPQTGTPEALQILFLLASRPGSRAVTLAYLQEHFAQVEKVFPAIARPAIATLFGSGCSAAEVERVEAFFAPRLKELGGGELELAQTRERIGLCAALKQARGADIAAALGGS
jgi:hypothetical protein